MKNDTTANELVLNGESLCDDDKLAQIIDDFKASLGKTPGIPVVLDLSKLSVIYSKGISVILGIFKSCKASGRSFKILVGANDILNLLRMLKLDKVFDIQKVEQ